MLSSPGFGSAWNHLNHTMFLYVLLACASWVLESHSAPMKIISGSTQDNHTAVCAEIEKELMADNVTYKVSLDLHQISLYSQWPSVFLTNFSCFQGSFERPQNTSEVRSSQPMVISDPTWKGNPRAETRTKVVGSTNLGRKLGVWRWSLWLRQQMNQKPGFAGLFDHYPRAAPCLGKDQKPTANLNYPWLPWPEFESRVPSGQGN